MSDPFYDISVVWEFFAYTSGPAPNMDGGLPGNDAAYMNQYGIGEHYCYDYPNADNCTYEGNGWIKTSGTLHSSLSIETGYIGGSYDVWAWNFSTMYPGDHPTFTLEFWWDIHGTSGIIYDNAYWDDDLGTASLPVDLAGNLNGVWMEKEAGELVVYTGFGATSGGAPIRHPTGLVLSGEQHMLIQYKEGDMHFIVGLEGDTFKVPVPWTNAYDEHALGASKWSWNDPKPVNPRGCQLSVRSIRVTTKRQRYGDLDTGLNTYTVPVQGYPDFSLPADRPIGILQMPTDEYGETRYDYDRLWNETSEPVYRCVNVEGGTPPYTYEWVCFLGYAGNLNWCIQEPDTPEAKFNVRLMTEQHTCWPVCIITDANGVVGSTTPKTGSPYADDGKWQGPWDMYVTNTYASGNEEVWATVGETAYLEANKVMHGFHRKKFKADYWPMMAEFAVLDGGSANGSSVLLSPKKPFDPVIPGTPDNYPQGSPDAYMISPVTIEDEGVAISVTAYGTLGAVEMAGKVTLRVIDVPNQDGWWTNVIDAQQTLPPGSTDALRPYAEAEAEITALKAQPDFVTIQPAIEAQMWSFEDPNQRQSFTEFDVAYRAWYWFDELPAYWTTYNVGAPARLNPWNLDGPKEFAYGQAVDLAYWSQAWWFGARLTLLPETGSVFQEVFNAAYRGCWEGYAAGQLDRLAPNPEFTSRIPDPNYSGPYPDDYVSAYNDGYEFGWVG